METGLKGRTAIISGASGNIGRAVSLALAREGADLALCARASVERLESVAAQARALGVRALARQCDVTRGEDVRKFVDAGLSEFGRIDVLINAATVWLPEKPAWEIAFSDWQRKIAVDLFGVVNMSQAVLPAMVRGKFGRIISFSGIAAAEGLEASTATTKMGVVGFTRGLAGLFAADGITANCVSPGGIEAERDAGPPRFPPAADQPITRAGTVAEVASLVTYLAGTGAAYITGQCYAVNGGRYFAC
jgi:3-oxoacyl-[acyl-carrier protein] reductase